MAARWTTLSTSRDQWFERVWIANVAALEAVAGLQIAGRRTGVAVHLWFEIVEENDLVAGVGQRVGQVGADEAGPTGDQDAFAHYGASLLELARSRKRSSSSSGTR